MMSKTSIAAYANANTHTRRAFMRSAGMMAGGLAALGGEQPGNAAADDCTPDCKFEDSPAGREAIAPAYVFPPSPKPRRRERLSVVAADPSKWKKLNDAYSAMKKLASGDPRNWCFQANMHYNHCSQPRPNRDYYLEIHHSSNGRFFFPWHRAYLFFYESILGGLIGDDGFALPYWDWGTDPVIPDGFFDQGSCLYYSYRDIQKGQSILDDPDNGPQVNQQHVDGIVNDNHTYDGFSTDLAGGPHNAGHSWVGGHMGSFPRAARDFLFFAHHANVDRQWARWTGMGNTNPAAGSAWAKQWFNFWDPSDPTGKLVSVTAKDTVERMGNIEYVLVNPEVVLTPVDKDVSRETYRSKPVPAAAFLKDVVSARARRSTPSTTPVRLLIEGFVATPEAPMLIRAFVNNPDADAMTPLDDRFIGTFSVVPMMDADEQGHHDGASHAPETLSLNVTDRFEAACKKVLEQKPDQQQLSVTLVVLGKDKKPSPAKIHFKSIRFVAEQD